MVSMSPPSDALPMSNKSTYLTDHHGAKVKELLQWLRVAKTATVILIFSVLVNLILMYGLIHYPCSPNPDRCVAYCTAVNAPRMLESPPQIEVPRSLPLSSLPVSKEVAIRESKIAVRGNKTESKELMVRPSSEVGAHLDATYLWFYVAMGAFYVTAQAVSWWNMVDACRDFSDTSDVINCVWGAVSTVVTAAGAFYGSYKTIGRIQTWASNNGIQFGGFKRDSIESGLLLGDLSSIFSAPVSHLGSFDFAPLGLNGTLQERESKDPIDVFGFKTPHGLDMHFSFLGSMENMQGNGKKQLAFKFGFGTGLVPEKDKRANFNQQYFTNGGIDFILDENPGDGGVLSVTNDYGQIDHEVSCLMGSTSGATGHYFQIYDNNHRGTIAGGAVAPFRGSDHWSAITQMYNEPWPISSSATCEVS
ncbi:hypothetical protein PVAG01_09868 [Phlyctema vagabunda]|uniref:Uncharacterized protein n=1 Tax=Phlyctema vagabunda TaxID=108571 RepID=A0ABR4P4B9_9HELO